MALASRAGSVPAGVRQGVPERVSTSVPSEGRQTQALLRVERLTVKYAEGSTERPALCEVSLAIRPGEALGVVGESGSGKTTLGLALLKMLPEGARATGAVRFAGQDLALLDEEALRRMRGARISAIYQEPGLALHPMMRAGDQIAEIYSAHFRVGRGEARAAAMKIAERVFHEDAARIFDAYPHELSGGQQQRVVIAQALVCRPGLVIADEPTASLDGESQREILELLLELKREMNLALLLITHNIALLPQIAERVLVMYAGRIVEQGETAQVLGAPRHPYTRMLVAFATGRAAAGSAAGDSQRAEEVPTAGCAFAPRCGERLFECSRKEPAEIVVKEIEGGAGLKAAAAGAVGPANSVRCFLYGH